MIFYFVSYDASYSERKYQEMQRISNSQKVQTKYISEIFILSLAFKFDQKQIRNNTLKFLEN